MLITLFREQRPAMRNLLMIATASLLISPHARAQQTTPAQPAATGPGLECFDHMDSPEYPAAAVRADVDGSVYTWVKLTPQGTVDKVDTEVASASRQASKLLVPAAEKVVRSSKFKSDCAGKTVAVVFRYHIWGQAGANPKVTTKTEPPDIINVDSQSEAGTKISSR